MINIPSHLIVSHTNISCYFSLIAEKSVLLDEEVLKSIVPLQPGDSTPFEITVMPAIAWKIQPKAEKIQSTLTFSYSCEEDETQGYGREISMVVDIKVMPSLSISNFDVYEIARYLKRLIISYLFFVDFVFFIRIKLACSRNQH